MTGTEETAAPEPYVGAVTRRLDELIPGNDPDLLRLYGLLVLATGEGTTLENVHDAWGMWRLATRPDHPSLVPFSRLSAEVQELDREYMEAIRKVAREISPAINVTPKWPRCPDGCGCRLGSDDADRSDCGCDRDPLAVLEEARARWNRVGPETGMIFTLPPGHQPVGASAMDIPRLLAGYDALLKAHKPVQIYADADGCGHECPPEPDWQADPDKAAVDAWDAYQDEHTYGTTPSGENDIRICMLTPDHQACPACSALVYSLWGDDEYVDASRCVALPLIAAALSGSETPS